MKCPACGTENPDDKKFCGDCGYSFIGGGQTGQLSPDTVLENRYIIVKTLGRGGMGAVYLALDTRLNNVPVAIKEMSNRAVGGDLQAAIGAFQKEASILIQLRHLAMPRIIDFFSRGEDRWYLVMDYIEGQTLKEIAELRGPIPEDEVLEWGCQLCEILGYLHKQTPPIIFRDLKPANIMLTPEGHIKLIDFGIARHFQPGRTADTSAYGSSGFAPPEQYGDNQTDARSDVYALGATLHYLLTCKDPGKNPFIFIPPGDLITVSRDFENAIMRALAFKAEDRPKSMDELLGLFPPAVKAEAVGQVSISTNQQIQLPRQESKSSGNNETKTTPLDQSAGQTVIKPFMASQDNITQPIHPVQQNNTQFITADRNDLQTSGEHMVSKAVVAVCLIIVLFTGAIYAFNLNKAEDKDVIRSSSNQSTIEKNNSVNTDQASTVKTPEEDGDDTISSNQSDHTAIDKQDVVENVPEQEPDNKIVVSSDTDKKVPSKLLEYDYDFLSIDRYYFTNDATYGRKVMIYISVKNTGSATWIPETWEPGKKAMSVYILPGGGGSPVDCTVQPGEVFHGWFEEYEGENKVPSFRVYMMESSIKPDRSSDIVLLGPKKTVTIDFNSGTVY